MPRSASGERCSRTSSDHALVNVPSANGRRRRSPSSERHVAPRFRGEERTDVDADRFGAQVAIPQRAPARCRSRDRRRDRRAPGAGTRAACRCGSSIRGAAATRARAARRHAAPRRDTSSARRTRSAAASRGSRSGPAVATAASLADERGRVRPRLGPAARQSGQRTSEISRSEIIGRPSRRSTLPKSASSRSARRAPTVLRDRVARRRCEPRRRAPGRPARRRDRRRPARRASPGRRARAFTPCRALRESRAGRRRRWRARPPCTRTA